MRNAIIIHGLQSEKEFFDTEKPSPSNAQWLPWTQSQLLAKGVLAQTPEMPVPYKPDYEAWKEVFEYFPLSASTILIGHSLGGGFILRWLSEHPSRIVGNVVLVAPWLDTEGRLESNFFDFRLNPNVAASCASLTIFYSDNDMERINKTINLCKNTLQNTNFKELKNHGHFLKKHMGTDAFPELLDTVLQR